LTWIAIPNVPGAKRGVQERVHDNISAGQMTFVACGQSRQDSRADLHRCNAAGVLPNKPVGVSMQMH
jgi:hypothetical protein